MVEAARLDAHRTGNGVAGHRADVRARYLPATRARDHQQHRRPDGKATPLIIGDLNMLAWTIYISFIGVALLMLLPSGNARAARTVGLLTALAGFVIALAGVFDGKPGEIQIIAKIPSVPSLGLEFHLAADGISLTLIVLTGLAAIAGIP